MIVTIVTFNLAEPKTLAEITKTFQSTAPKYQSVPGLLRKNYWMSEDGKRAGGIYVWESRADADRLYSDEWKKFVEGKYGTPPQIEYLHSPVMVDNRDGTIKVAAEEAAEAEGLTPAGEHSLHTGGGTGSIPMAAAKSPLKS